MLDRNYFFEFAGMPQSGKSIVAEIVGHFLKRRGLPIGEYRGGSRYSPLYNAPIGDLNLWLASRVVNFVIETIGSEKSPYKIFLLDKGLIDRYIFTNTLMHSGKIDENSASRINSFLTFPQLLTSIDGLFIFVTDPVKAVERENDHKLVSTPGEVMNVPFLSQMRTTALEGFYEVKEKMSDLIPNVHLIDFEQNEGDILKISREILSNIAEKVNRKRRVLLI